ncbi:hypothetical protein DICVIV_08056, partial [Dictyocaulus viviparus]
PKRRGQEFWRVHLRIDSFLLHETSLLYRVDPHLLGKMTHRENQIKRTISPIPEDPCHAPSTAGGYVRAQDNCLPMNLEMEMYRRQPLRAVSPSILPGVRRISKERSESLRSQLVPGKYFAKSFTQFLGPFDHEPTRDELPSGDTFFILQHYVHISRTFQDMGQVDELGKRIFQHVKQIYVPAKRFPAPRPISPTELPGVRSLDNELDEDMKRSLVPGFYFAK